MAKIQTKDEMIGFGATSEEADTALELFDTLRPSLKVLKNGRVETTSGDKTPLGLLRTIRSVTGDDELKNAMKEVLALASSGVLERRETNKPTIYTMDEIVKIAKKFVSE